MNNEPRILLWDIETSYLQAYTFGLYKDIVDHNLIIKDWHIICTAWKWLGERKIHSLQKDGIDNDYELCKAMREVLVEADIVVHHNGDKFDVKKFNARLIAHKLPPIPKLTTVDTLKAVKQVATFTSHRLDYLSKVLGYEGKDSTPKYLWIDATEGDPSAVKKMVKYCKGDIRELEHVYLELRPYFYNHPNMNVLNESLTNCRVCGSMDLIKRGFAITKVGKYQRFQCQSCGAWMQGKDNLIKGVDIR